MTSTLEQVCCAVEQGQLPTQAAMAAVLVVETREQRFRVNIALAKAYFYHTENHRQAAVFVERAFELSGTLEDCLSLFVQIQKSNGEADKIRIAYRLMGDRYAALGDIPNALRCYGMSRDTYALLGQGNQYEYDVDIVHAIGRLADIVAPSHPLPRPVPKREKIRVAYLVFHVRHPESVIVKLLSLFARHHDREKFEAVFFVSEPSQENDEVAIKNINALLGAGGRVVQTDEVDALKRHLDTARRIHSFGPHLLVTTAVLADFGHYFVSLLARAPVNIGLGYGPPELYMPPNLDWVISGTKQPLLDCPCDGSVVPVESALPDRTSLAIASRVELGIPDNALIVASAGRPLKFMSRQFWEAMIAFLELRPAAYFVAIGLDSDPPFLPELLSDRVRNRIVRFGWLGDYLHVLGAADIVVDTYPSGGGVVVIDSMALSIPVVSFRCDYFGRFNQMEWNPSEDLVALPDLIVDRGDFDGLVQRLVRLSDDEPLRRKLGAACLKIVRETMGSPARYVAHHEAIYETVLRTKAGKYSGAPLLLRMVTSLMAWLSRKWFAVRWRITR